MNSKKFVAMFYSGFKETDYCYQSFLTKRLSFSFGWIILTENLQETRSVETEFIF